MRPTGKGIYAKFHRQIKIDILNNIPYSQIAIKYEVTKPTVCSWKKRIIKEMNEPVIEYVEAEEVSVDETKQAKTPAKNTEKSAKPDKQTKHVNQLMPTIDISTLNFKRDGLTFLDLAIGRMIQLIPQEKSLKDISQALSVVLPYLIPKVEGDGDGGETFEQKRIKFIQNFITVYKQNGNGKENKKLSNNGDSKESTAGSQ